MPRQQPDIIEDTMGFWSKRTKQPISREDVRQMVMNVAGFFQVLAEWDSKTFEEEQKGVKHEGPSTTRRVDK
jgi:hypothetical protein